MRGHSAPTVEEVLGTHAGRDQPAVLGESTQVLVEAVFVGLLVFETHRFRLSEDRTQIFREVLAVILIP